MAVDPRWTIRPAAQADLSGIWLTGVTTWGDTQAEHYVDGLFAVFDLLAGFPDLVRERLEFSPAVRIHPTGAHLVVYRQDAEGIEIIRILHARQDLNEALQD